MTKRESPRDTEILHKKELQLPESCKDLTEMVAIVRIAIFNACDGFINNAALNGPADIRETQTLADLRLTPSTIAEAVCDIQEHVEELQGRAYRQPLDKDIPPERVLESLITMNMTVVQMARLLFERIITNK